MSALGGVSPGGKLIAGGLLGQPSGAGMLQQSVGKLSKQGDRAGQSGDRALGRLGAPLGGGLARAFGGVTSSLSASFDQSGKIDQSLKAGRTGASSGLAAKRARSTSAP